MTELDLNKIEQRVIAENKMIDQTCSNIESLFSGSNKEKVSINDDEKSIYREFPEGKISAQKMMKFIFRCLSWWDRLCYVVYLCILLFVSLMIVQCMHIIVFPTLAKADSSLLLSAAILLLCLYIGKIIFESILDTFTKRICIKVEHSVQYAVIHRIMSLTSTSLSSFFADDLGQVVFIAGVNASDFLKAILKAIAVSIVGVGLIIQINWYAPTLFIPTLIIVVLFLVFVVSYVSIQKKYIDNEAMHEIVSLSLAQSIIRSIQKIRLYNSERRAFSWWADSYYQKLYSNKNIPFIAKYYKEIIRFLELICLAIIFMVANQTHVIQGSFYIFLIVYAIIVTTINVLTDNLLVLGRVGSSFKSLNNFWNASIENSEYKESIEKLSGNITLTRVKFKYGEDLPYVLDDISLEIKSGQSIAIVGKTGCGKSTLVRLLMGFENPTQGTIFYDRKDLVTLDLRCVRSNIGIVQQEGKLINGSIEENILISNPMLKKEDVHRAAKIAGIHDEIMKFPMGYQTIISDETNVISGGQRQRILIARAVVNNPKILIFDEATSALDNNTQKYVTDALDKLQATKIIIAHRLSTIKNADRIILIDNGTIAEDGTYEELISSKGKFFELVEMQRL